MNKPLTGMQEFWITSMGLGKLRPASGTWGSLPPVGVATALIAMGIGPSDSSPAIALYTLVMLAICAAFSLVCVRAGDMAEAHFGKKDPGSVTADETAGMALTLLALPASSQRPLEAVLVLLSAFVLFRLMDILKPFPAYRLQRVPGGWGILLDDLVAGVQALVLVQVLWRVVV